MDVTTLALAVDSTQVITAASALDKFAVSGTRAEVAATTLKRATDASSKTLAGAGQAASKSALSFRTLEEAQAALGPRAAAALAKTTGELGATEAKADAAAAAMHRLGNEAQLAGAKAGAALAGAGGGARVPTAGTPAAVPSAAPRPGPAAPAPVSNPAAPVVKGNQDIEKSARLAAFQQQQLGFQIHDFAVQVISGQSPITALVQQGSQLSGTFGGAGNAFRAVLGLITPMRLAMAGAAVAVGGLVVAMTHAESAARDLAAVQAQLAGTGRSDLFNDKELKDYLNQLALAPGVTRDMAGGIVSELAKVHDIGGALFKDLGAIAVDYAKATGQDVPAAAKELARAFADPERGAKQLEAALGSLSSSQQLEIERLTRLGDLAGAQRVLFQALQSAVRGLADNAMTPLQRSTNELGNAWERLSRAFGESEGLRSLTALLAGVIDKVAWLIEHAPKLGGLSTLGATMIPGAGGPLAIANAATSGIKSLFGIGQDSGATAAQVKEVATAKASNTAATERSNKAVDEETKRTLDATKGYRSQAQQIADLVKDRERLNKVIKESKDPAVVKEARGRVAGVNERIASAQKKGSGGGNEAQQGLDAQLAGQVKATRDALAAERDAMAFTQRYLQGVFQAGEISLRDFYAQKRKAIEEGTAAEIAGLEQERAKVQAHLEATKKTSPKDTSKIQEDQNRLADIDREQEKFRLNGAREVVLVNQEEAGSFKQLTEQVLNYRASLLQLQGDEEGAAKVRAQAAIEQARVLSAQSGGAISQKDLDAYAKATQQSNDLALSRNRLTATTQQLAIDEERIAFLQSKGAIGELAALGQLGAARAARLGQIQKEVEAIEKLAKERPLDLQLNIDASRARLELDKLKADLDPLKEKFDGLFKDAGANLFGDLMNGTKPRDAIRNFANSITKEINASVGRDLSNQLFGKDGPLGGAGGFLADIFGGTDRKKPKAGGIDTTAVDQSLASFRTTGVDPATSALTDLSRAAEATAVSLRQVSGKDLPPAPGTPGATGDFARFDRAQGAVPTADGSGETGDFARFDRAQDVQTDTAEDDFARAKSQSAFTGEESVTDLFRSADTAAAANGRAAESVLGLASAALRGGGALNSLPSVVNAIIQAAQAASGSGGGGAGGLIGAGLNYLFSGGGSASAFAPGGVAGSGFGTGLAFGNEDIGLFLAKGGYTGDKPVDEAVGIVHGREYVFSAPATKRIGLGTLERMHKQATAGDAEGVAMTAVQGLRGARELGGPVSAGGLYRINERGPEVLEVGGAQYLMTGSKAGEVKPAAAGGGAGGDVFHLHMTMPPGTSRATAAQMGASALQGATHEARRLGRRV